MSACISPSDALLARRLIELTQAGLPLVADPWAWIAAQLRLRPASVRCSISSPSAVPSPWPP